MQDQEIPTTNEDVEVVIPVEYDNEPIQGISATIKADATAQTLPAGSEADVELTNSGDEHHADYHFKFKIPRGDKGDRGEQGDKGETGESATIKMSASATTLSAGSQATATITNSGDSHNADYTLALGIPQGAKGDRGERGVQGERGERGEQGIQGIQGIQGETGEAFSIYKTYPSIADMNADASNVPEGKFTLIASNVDDPDNSKLFVKNGEGTFTYLTDMSGAQGIQGERGEQGIQGIQGIQGVQGERGLTGSVKSLYVSSESDLPSTGAEDTFYLTDKDTTTGTVQGNPVSITNTQTAGQVTDFELQGGTSQVTLTGKNLANYLNTVKATNDTTLTFVDNGFRQVTTSAGFGAKLQINGLQPSTTYTLSWNLTVNSGTAYKVVRIFEGTGQSVIYETYNQVSIGAGHLAFTTGASATSVNIWFYNGIPNAGDTTWTYIQLEKSDSSSSYEPYVGGTPSPNPSYPQDINVVTGEQTIVQEGKNLFDGQFGQGQVYNTQAQNRITSTQSPLLTGGQAYTLSVSDLPTGYWYVVALYRSPAYPGASAGTAVYDSGWKTDASLTFTPTEDLYYSVVMRKSDNSNLTPSDVSDVKFQLEQANQASTFEPYWSQTYPLSLGSVELAKIGTYQDRIYKTGGKWYVEKNVGKVVLDGTENWADYPTQYTGWYIAYANSKRWGHTGSFLSPDLFKCDHFQSSDGNFTAAHDLMASTMYACYAKVPSTIASTADAFKTWLSTHPTTIYYALATPTTTEITDSTLISQLEAIKNAELNTGLNTFTNSATAPNLAGEFEIDYELWEKYNKHDVYIWNDAINDYQKIVGLEGSNTP